ncbi:hypothetical protein KMS_R28130 [Pseudomonas sp. LRP2-20]|nr:hypothetical protein KMS_R28130 [Pseudomonas sp. LRP2-20]
MAKRLGVRTTDPINIKDPAKLLTGTSRFGWQWSGWSLGMAFAPFHSGKECPFHTYFSIYRRTGCYIRISPRQGWQMSES